MRKQAFTIAVGAVFFFALAASTVHADMVDEDQFQGRMNGIEHQRFVDLLDTDRSESHGYLFAEHSDNGKHLGFSVSSFHHGPTIGLVGHNPNQFAATPNPEPTTMILLGTGLAAVGAAIRRKKIV